MAEVSHYYYGVLSQAFGGVGWMLNLFFICFVYYCHHGMNRACMFNYLISSITVYLVDVDRYIRNYIFILRIGKGLRLIVFQPITESIHSLDDVPIIDYIIGTSSL